MIWSYYARQNFRFTIGELAFFNKWWTKQTKSVRQDVKKLVHEGQFEFAGTVLQKKKSNFGKAKPGFIWKIFDYNNGLGEKIFLFWSTVIGGGWTQNDEATTHFTAIIDDLTLGFNFIEENFGNFYFIFKFN